MKRWVSVLVVFAAVVATAACGDDDKNAVKVTLGEFVVELGSTTAKTGEVSFDIHNGGSETHELVVVRADSADALPTDADGAVDETGIDAGDAIGEAEDIAKDADTSLKFDLTAGTYVLFCNVVEEEDSETVSHFAKGMHSTLTISE